MLRACLMPDARVVAAVCELPGHEPPTGSSVGYMGMTAVKTLVRKEKSRRVLQHRFISDCCRFLCLSGVFITDIDTGR